MDDFEEMLEAVCNAQAAEVAGDDAPPRPQTKNYTTDTYAPLDRIDLALATFVSRPGISFTRADYENAKQLIQSALQRRQLRPRHVKYLGVLYPELLAQSVLLAETADWPGCDLDHVLEYMLVEWLQSNKDVTTYLTDLFAAIKTEAVYNLTILFLNRSVLNVSDDQIIINTARPFGHPRRAAAKEIVVKQIAPAYTEPVRQQIITFLRKQNCYSTNDATVGKLIQQFSGRNKEQVLLGKLGYLIIRVLSKSARTTPGLAPALPKLLTQQ
jgi:hypothetical protein